MSAREERLLTPETIAAVDQWLDDADVFAKGYWQYVNGELVTVGLRIGKGWDKVVAFFGDTVVRHEGGTHTVLSAKDAAEVSRLLAERHSTNEALDDAVQALKERDLRIAELEAAAEKVAGFCAQRAEYVNNLRNCNPNADHDYYRWTGHAEARRQLSQLLGLPVAWPAEDATVPVPAEDVSPQVAKLRSVLAPTVHPTAGELAEQRHLMDPLDHLLESLAPCAVAVAVPSSCRWCGVEQDKHGGRWKTPIGWHRYVPPTQALIKARMIARRQARTEVTP
ncbi:hypothetical protein ACFZDF_30435 [Streptomyces sp. NPDC007910]|uniref:hypothetical protein n=1 Tax=Streptomyces sp. NPDC007910 TaxID=3364790 RepID=UPI0036EB1FBA